MALEDRHHHVVILGDRLQRLRIGRLDAAEHRREQRLAHQLEDFRPLGDVERRLAGQQQRIAVALLPLDQVRQQLAHGALVGDEIVVDEIDRGGQPAGHELVELGADLLGRLVARDAAVERRDVAELALIRAAAGELDAAEEIAVDLRQLVGRDREFGQLAPLVGGEHDLARRAAWRRRTAARTTRRWRRPARRRAGSRSPGNAPGRPTPRSRPAPRPGRSAWARRRMSSICRRCTCMPLTNTTSAQAKSSSRGRRHVLVDEADLPGRRHRGGDDQQPLRRHEGANAVGQRIGEFEGAERGRVARKHAQHAPSDMIASCKHQDILAWTEGSE